MNTALLLQLATAAATAAANYTAVVAKANAEGRDATDAEVATARAAAQSEIDALAAL